jgi:hypothetical protein
MRGEGSFLEQAQIDSGLPANKMTGLFPYDQEETVHFGSGFV